MLHPTPLSDTPPDSPAVWERNLYLSKLPPKLKSESLKEYFEQFGPVEVTTIRRNPNNPSETAYGFVLFRDVESANRALEQRHVIEGKRVSVRKCRPSAAPGHYISNTPRSSVSSIATESTSVNSPSFSASAPPTPMAMNLLPQQPPSVVFVNLSPPPISVPMLSYTFPQVTPPAPVLAPPALVAWTPPLTTPVFTSTAHEFHSGAPQGLYGQSVPQQQQLQYSMMWDPNLTWQ